MTKIDKQPLMADADKFIVRLPEGMRNRISDAAKANNRSMNAEIIARIQSTFDTPPSSLDLDAIADQLAEKIAKKLKAK